jgi:hypothetical protein
MARWTPGFYMPNRISTVSGAYDGCCHQQRECSRAGGPIHREAECLVITRRSTRAVSDTNHSTLIFVAKGENFDSCVRRLLSTVADDGTFI